MSDENAIAAVALSADDYLPVGYCIINRNIDKYTIRRMAVTPRWQRLGVGAAMVRYYKCSLPSGMRRLEAIVKESSLATQMFFMRQGFKWQETLPNRFTVPQVENGYRLTWED